MLLGPSNVSLLAGNATAYFAMDDGGVQNSVCEFLLGGSESGSCVEAGAGLLASGPERF